MSQKINPISFRLSKRLNWEYQYATNKKNYAQAFMLNNESSFFTNYLFNKLGFFINTSNFSTSIKNNKVFLNLIDELLKKSKKSSRKRNDSSLYSRLHYNLGEISLQTIFPNNLKKNVKKNSVQLLNKTNNQEIIKRISCDVICRNIIEQLQKPQRLKDKTFLKNLNIGLTHLTKLILNTQKSQIIGLKIMCSGKWQKTRSGRKQKITVYAGKLQRPTITSLLSYCYLQSTTKHGSCGVKVWINYRK